MSSSSSFSVQEDKSGSSRSQRVAVVGAGVSGLAAAYKLHLHGLDVTVFEADERAGGKLKSVSQNGLVWDEGANTMTESDPEVSFVLDNLGLRQKKQYPISQNKRYIARNGRPVLIPSNPLALISSCFLSTKSKCQILLEPLLWKKNVSVSSDEDESVGGFFERHFGKEVVDYVIDPFVAGTSGGDPESLYMPYAFPDLWNLEKRFGSIVSGAFKSKLSSKMENDKGVKSSGPDKKRQRGSFSFLGGMQILVDSLCTNIGNDKLELRSKVLELSCSCPGDSSWNSWTVSYCSQNVIPTQEKSFDAVVVTAPLCEVKDLKITKRGNPFLLDFVPDITYLPLTVMITAFKKVNVKQPLEGFGVLIPSKEQENGLKTLGTLFSSMMFPDRAPSDVYLYTTFVGGSRNKELAKASRVDLKEIVTSDLRQLLGAEGEPTFLSHLYWSKAFPLYGRNYKAVMQAIDKLEHDLPGFFYAGNHKEGLSVGKAISSGCKAADHVISYLDSWSNDNTEDDSQRLCRSEMTPNV